jgi:hypothetical protein
MSAAKGDIVSHALKVERTYKLLCGSHFLVVILASTVTVNNDLQDLYFRLIERPADLPGPFKTEGGESRVCRAINYPLRHVR